MTAICEISVVIPTWQRSASLREALEQIFSCDPAPSEVLIHVDAGDSETVPMLEREFADTVTWFQSETTQGPGGGRNLLLKRAKFPLAASFDDDSWPLDLDYFSRVTRLMEENPSAAVLTGQVALRGENPSPNPDSQQQVASFEGCGCVFRQSAFLQTRGFIPLRYAYGMEEVDVAMQFIDAGWSILRVPSLRIFHDTKLNHHESPALNAAHIRNTALYAFLHYPLRFWPVGIAQVLNRVLYALRVKRYRGILQGIIAIPPACWCHSASRKPVSVATFKKVRQLKSKANY